MAAESIIRSFGSDLPPILSRYDFSQMSWLSMGLMTQYLAKHLKSHTLPLYNITYLSQHESKVQKYMVLDEDALNQLDIVVKGGLLQ